MLILDRLDEGLALLHVVHGFPFEVLPYITSNQNRAVSLPNITEAFKDRVAKELLKLDYQVYKDANDKVRASSFLGFPFLDAMD